MLLMGHRGCGKTTEMYTFIRAMKGEEKKPDERLFGDKRFLVADISAREYLDLNAATYVDVLVMMMTELAKAAQNEKLDLREKAVQPLLEYWKTIIEKEKIIGFGGTVEVEVSPWDNLLGLFKTLKAKMIAEASTRQKIKTQIDPDVNTFINKMWEFNENVQTAWYEKTGQTNLPIIVVDDLDRLPLDRAEDIFYVHGSTLALLPMHVIYTFPIQLSYSSKFNSIKAYFSNTHVLPMIKLRDWVPGKGYNDTTEGKNVLHNIIEKRANIKRLFTEPALNLLIEKTGGFLRDLFIVIAQAARLANRRESSKIEEQDAETALLLLQSELGRMFHVDHYPMLRMIYEGKKTDIHSRDEMLDLLDGRIIMEYNGVRWCDLYPLVEDLLKATGVLTDVERENKP